MKIECAYDKLIPIDELKPHPHNHNIHPDDQIKRLANILLYQGWRSPVKVSNQSGFITAGHGRLAAAKLNGWKEVPVDFQDYENSNQEYADVQADNAIASWAALDISNINMDLPDLGPDFDIEMLGIKDFELEPADKYNSENDDAVPDMSQDKEPITKLGDLIELGNHRLLCGDCTIKENVDRLMNGEKADMVFTDPPYGMNLDTEFSNMASEKSFAKGGKHRKIIDDDKPFDAQFIFDYFGYCKEILLWGADYYLETICRTYANLGSWFVWDKRLEESADKMYGNCFELCWSKNKHKRDIARIKWAGCFGLSSEDTKNRVHPTQKPTALIEWFFDRIKGENVIDIFLGSGSTLIACEKTNRKCYGMELDPHYCDVIINRYCDYVQCYDIIRNGNKEKVVSNG